MFVLKSISICNVYINYDEIIIKPSLFKHIFLIFLFERYFKRTLKYLEKEILSHFIHMITIIDHIGANVETIMTYIR